VFVIRAFVKMRETLLGTRELAKKLALLEKKLTGRLDVHEAAIVKVLQDLMQILNPPPLPLDPPQRQVNSRRAVETEEICPSIPLAVCHNIARTKQAHGTSRHRTEVSRTNLGVDLFQSASVLSARRKVLFEFFIPNELVLPRDERAELGQLFAAQLFYRFLYFRQAHARRVPAAAPADNQIAARSRTLPNSHRRGPNAFGSADNVAAICFMQHFVQAA